MQKCFPILTLLAFRHRTGQLRQPFLDSHELAQYLDFRIRLQVGAGPAVADLVAFVVGLDGDHRGARPAHRDRKAGIGRKRRMAQPVETLWPLPFLYPALSPGRRVW